MSVKKVGYSWMVAEVPSSISRHHKADASYHPQQPQLGCWVQTGSLQQEVSWAPPFHDPGGFGEHSIAISDPRSWWGRRGRRQYNPLMIFFYRTGPQRVITVCTVERTSWRGVSSVFFYCFRPIFHCSTPQNFVKACEGNLWKTPPFAKLSKIWNRPLDWVPKNKIYFHSNFPQPSGLPSSSSIFLCFFFWLKRSKRTITFSNYSIPELHPFSFAFHLRSLADHHPRLKVVRSFKSLGFIEPGFHYQL